MDTMNFPTLEEALKYIKIGVDHGMPRYARSRAKYEECDDMVLRLM